jgi:PAS domain S-box-containing protein
MSMSVVSNRSLSANDAETELAAALGELAELRARLSAETALRAKLQESLELRNTALDAASTHFMIVDAQEPHQPIVYVNRAHALQHGYPAPEQLIGQSISVLMDTYSPPENKHALYAAMREGRPIRVEMQAAHRDGSRSWLGISSAPLHNDQDQVTHFVTLGADITSRLDAERKKDELQNQLVNEMRERERMAIELRLAQKLESVGRLAAGLAHEINTPIQYVSDSVYFLKSAFEDLARLFYGYRDAVGTLARGADDQAVVDGLRELEVSTDFAFLSDEVPKAFARTAEGVERVAGIVRAMKEFAYPDVGEHSPADLNHALTTTLTVARSEYKYAASVTTQFEDLPNVLCNISELNQVFLNLIVNAAHAIHDSGKDFASGQIAITTRRADEEIVEIVIADNGCGIGSENLDRIFDPFFTTKEVGRGTGQGLAIARAIVVDKHGGDISVSSELGRGTQFTVRLPLNSRRREKARP